MSADTLGPRPTPDLSAADQTAGPAADVAAAPTVQARPRRSTKPGVGAGLGSKLVSRPVRGRTLAERLRGAPHRFEALHAIRLAELGMARLPSPAASVPRPAEGTPDRSVDDGTAAVGLTQNGQAAEALAEGVHAADAAAPDDALLPAPPDDVLADPVRLEAVQGLAFAPAAMASLVDRGGRLHARMAFLGLTGPLGVLPQPYSELVQKADRARNRAVSAFLDLFNHRLGTLFVRAGEKYRLGLLLQHAASTAPRGAPPPSAGADPGSRAMLALAGYGTPHLRGRMAVPDDVVLFYAGLFAHRQRPPAALRSMLCDFLGMDVRVEPFSGRWVPVAATEQSRLPRAGEAPRFVSLGVDAVAGGRIWDVQGAFRVVVGPVDDAGMRALMPDGPVLRRLVDLVRAYAGLDLEFDVQVILRADCVPDLVMPGPPEPHAAAPGPHAATPGPRPAVPGPHAAVAPPRLGWNTWAKSLPALADKADIILDPNIVMARPQAGRMALEPT